MAVTVERAELHRLLDLLPEEELPVAGRLLEGLLVLHGGWTMENAPMGPPLSPVEEKAVRQSEKDIAAGRVFSHEEVKKRLGLD